MNYRHFVLSMVVLAIMPLASQAATAVIGASKDNSIYQSAGNNSAGGAAGIFSGTNGQGSPRRGLLAFDVAANLPAGATVTAAQLTLYLGNASNANDHSIGLHRLTVDWGEGTAGSSTPGIGGGGSGFAAGTGDATWNAHMHPSMLWGIPGGTGDFLATASASAVVGSGVETPHTWLSTPDLVSDVQNWLSNPATNFGWALVNANEAASGTVKVFYSRSATQSSTGGALDPARRPALMVTYVVPEPPMVAALLLAGPILLRMRWR